MEIKKPEMSEKEKELGNKVYHILMSHEKPITKEFICSSLGWEYNSSTERKVRMLLSYIGKVKPLISTSDQKGYYIARKVEDLETVKHQWLEHNKRVQEINERIAPLQKFIEQFENK